MKKPRFCLDTSGITNRLHHIPIDIFHKLWEKINKEIEDGTFTITEEIYNELEHNHDEKKRHSVYDTIHESKKILVFNTENHIFAAYKTNYNKIYTENEEYVAKKGTKAGLSVADISIISLAYTLKLPLISEEIKTQAKQNTKNLKIPNICEKYEIEHIDFNGFLRKNNIKS